MGNPSTIFTEIASPANLKPRGELTIIAVDKAGNRVTYQTPNVIVYDAKETMAHLLVGDSVTAKKVSTLGVGIDNTAPTRDNTALANKVLEVAFSSITYPAKGQVEMTGILDYVSPSNGQIINEAGLFSADGTLFARQVFGDITKTSALQLQFIWRIIYT